MGNTNDWAMSKDLLQLLAHAAGTPITICEVNDKGEPFPIETFQERYYPKHCEAVWALDGGRGKTLCKANMRARVSEGTQRGQHMQTADFAVCHAGVSTIRIPIWVEGKVIAVIQFAKFVPKSELPQQLEARINLHKEAMEGLNVSSQDSARIVDLLLNDAPHYSPEKIDRLKAALEQAAQIISAHITQSNRLNRSQQSANHDLQIRLQAAIAFAELLAAECAKQTGLSPSLQTGIENVLGAVETASLAMHGATQGRYLPEYRFKSHTIEPFIQRSEMLCRAEARTKGIQLQTDLHQARISASEDHLQVAFDNLLQNAVKYSYRQSANANHRFVRILGRVTRGGYEITISNYGVGIEQDEIDLVFNEGYQGRLTKLEYRSGGGQGLAITKQIIQEHQGQIRCFSKPAGEPADDGSRPFLTRFVLWLPFKRRGPEVKD